MYDRFTDRVLDMVNDALARGLSFSEIVDSVDFSLSVLPAQTGPQMIGLLYVAVKGPVIGSVIGSGQVILNVGALSLQAVVDEQVRQCLEAIRAQKAQVLTSSNGHN